MKQKAIKKAISALNPLFSEEFYIKWKDDEELIKNFMDYYKVIPTFFEYILHNLVK